MNYRMSLRILGLILLCLAALLLLPLAVGLIYGERVTGFIITILLSAAVGFLLCRKEPENKNLYARDGFLIVGGGWLLMSLFGALPFVISGDIPNFIDAFFETASGLTTTGASVVTNVEAMTRGGMFWRMFTHWIGGMGVLVFIMAVLPMNGEHSMHIMRAEVPGPTVGKLVPRAGKTARILYIIYLGLTLLEAILLKLGGLSLYEAVLHAFATAGTGGFSTRAASIGAFDSLYVEMVVSAFMFLFSINFNLYFLLLIGRARDVFKNEELRCFVCIVLFAAISIAINIAPIYGGFFPALRHSIFNTLTLSSTSGFGTVDFTQWPAYSQTILVMLTLVGATAGSTGGGIKLSRVMILVKAAACDFMGIIQPRSVRQVRLENHRVGKETVHAIYTFCSLYALLAIFCTLFISFDGHDLLTNITASISCLSNIGPGLGLIGPHGSFAVFSYPSKIVLSFMMLIGRLEIYPILALFVPGFWRQR